MTSRSRQPGAPDQGFTLIELLIAAALTITLLVAVGGLLISAQRSQAAIRSATASATLGELIARSVTQRVANATGVTVTTNGATGAQMLQARVYVMTSANDPTQGAASGTSCQAWYYSPIGGGAIYTKTTTPAAAITMPSGAVDSTWHLIGNGLGVQVDTSPSSTIFATPSGTRVDLKFDVVNGSEKPVHIETTVHIPNTTTVSSPCF